MNDELKPDLPQAAENAQPEQTVSEQTLSEQASPEQLRSAPPQPAPFVNLEKQAPPPVAPATPVGNPFASLLPPTPQPAEEWPPEEPPRSGTRLILAVAITVFVMLFLFAGYCIYRDVQRGTTSGGYRAGDIVEVSIGVQHKPEVDEDYVDENGRYSTEGLATAVRPSIVEIYTYKDDKTASPIGSGSGIIISKDGYIVTNAHVLEGGGFLQVRLDRDDVYAAKLVGRDAKTDLAVVKINAQDLTAAVLGDSDEVLLGEEVVAIGNPAGLSGSISNGIVSGLNRKIRTETTSYEMTCIQTNAAISPGNSGGALVNMFGQVIGITSSKYVNSSYEGLGFAITINEALPIIQELMEQGYISGRYRLGISFLETTSPYTKYNFEQEMGFPLPESMTEGVWIREIAAECDISNTELTVGDFIMKVNGKDVHDYDSLIAALGDSKAGDTVSADCIRLNKTGGQHAFSIRFKLMEDTSGDF